jgi:cobalt/nickel transport system permease protein
MLSRGFDGKAPDLAVIGAPPRAAAMQWAIVMTPAAAAVAVSVLARVTL